MSDPERRPRAGMPAGTVVAVLRHPDVWWVAVRQAGRLAGRGWWRRRTFLPVPDPDYLRFRMVTAYGGEGGRAAGRRRPDHLPPLVSHLAGVEGVNDVDGTDPPASIRLVRVSVPVRRPHRSAHGTDDVRESILVRWRSADGVDGWGECPTLAGGGYVVETPDEAWSALTGRLFEVLASPRRRPGMLTPGDPTVPGRVGSPGGRCARLPTARRGIRLADHLARQTDGLVRPTVADHCGARGRGPGRRRGGRPGGRCARGGGVDDQGEGRAGTRRRRAGRRTEHASIRSPSPPTRTGRWSTTSSWRRWMPSASPTWSSRDRSDRPWADLAADRAAMATPVALDESLRFDPRPRSGGSGRGARRCVGQAGPNGRGARRGPRRPAVCRIGTRRLRRGHVRARHRAGDRERRGIAFTLFAADRPRAE